MDARLKNLNRFVAGMLDIGMSRNPLAQDVIVVFNDVIRDHYRDVVDSEVSRQVKTALVKKDTDLNYVQELGDILVEDVEQIPWTVSMTMTDLPRIPAMDDHVIIEDKVFTVSMVKPINRKLESVVLLFVYPERTDPEPLSITSLDVIVMGDQTRIKINYTGYPTEYSVDGETWYPFSKYVAPDKVLYKITKLSESALELEIPSIDVAQRVYIRRNNIITFKVVENYIRQ